MEKEQIRSYIQIRQKLNISTYQIHQELVSSFGEDAPCEKTVYNWVERFKSGQESVQDQMRIGRPKTISTSENINIIKGIIEEDPHISIRDIEELTQISKSTVERIIHEDLNLTKLTSRWIPQNLTEQQKRNRVQICQQNLQMFEENKWRLCDIITGDETWIYHRKIHHKQQNKTWVEKGQFPPAIVRRNTYENKSMVTVFFKSTGPLLVNVLDQKRTIDNVYYVNNCLQPLVQEIQKQRPYSGTQNLKLLHDNCKPHTHSNTINFLQSAKIKVIDHPPYSPDLAPSDYWLFNIIKQKLPDETNHESLQKQIYRHTKLDTQRRISQDILEVH